jgi:hypothetical protein
MEALLFTCYLDLLTTEVSIDKTAAPAETENTPTQSTIKIPTEIPPMVAMAVCEKVLIALSPANAQNSRLNTVILLLSSFHIFVRSNGCVGRHNNC